MCNEQITFYASRTLHHPHRTSPLGLFDLDPIREGIFELVEMGDDENFGKVILDRIDGLDQTLTSKRILRADIGQFFNLATASMLLLFSKMEMIAQFDNYIRASASILYFLRLPE